MFIRMAKLSSCVSNPDCAGPAANSDAVKVRYLLPWALNFFGFA